MINNLKELIDNYAHNKNELDSYKELCDKANKEIKDIMKENDLTSFDTDNYTAKLGVQERTKFDEDTAINILKNSGLSSQDLKGIIKKKEYIDMDALESAIYHGKIMASDLSKANSVTQVYTLKVSIKKEK